jgi:hypothetical protein
MPSLLDPRVQAPEECGKRKATHDLAATFSLEITVAALTPATSSLFGSRHLASPKQVAGPVKTGRS